VTDLAARMVTVQVVPETASHPLQPLKTERGFSVTARVTVAPLL